MRAETASRRGRRERRVGQSRRGHHGRVGGEGYDQKGLILTSNATAGAVSIAVNTPAGGTGDAILGQGSVGNNTGGGITVASNGGNILWSTAPFYGTFGAPETGLGNTGSNTRTLRAYTYAFTTGATGSVGTNARPLQLDNFGLNAEVNTVPNLTASAGTGGVYATVWDGNATDLTTGSITAQGAGDIRVVTANAGGHNLWVNGPISTGSGNIYLAADDNIDVLGNVVIGGGEFRGTVWMQANRDQGTAGQTFTMAASLDRHEQHGQRAHRPPDPDDPGDLPGHLRGHRHPVRPGGLERDRRGRGPDRL